MREDCRGLTIRVEHSFATYIDADQWQAEMMPDQPEASTYDVRSSVRQWARSQVMKKLQDRELLKPPPRG